MRLIRKLDQLDSSIQGGALAIGNFDGVHRGHAQIVERVCYWASKFKGPSVALTFDPHPVRILRPDLAPPPLTWTARKAEMLGQLGVEFVVAVPTDRKLLELTYDEFFEQLIRQQMNAQAIIEGPNFHFGRDRQGDVGKLAQLCADHNMECEIVPPVHLGTELISSTRIRQAISSGQLALAAHMLTSPFRIRGMVVHGAGRGHEMGFPTANLDAIDTMIPSMGVYAGRATVADAAWAAAIHIGPSPTFGEDLPKVEVHLLDYDEAIYGQVMEVDFYCRLRGTRQFDSIAQLKQQLQRDVRQARTVCDSARTETPDSLTDCLD